MIDYGPLKSLIDDDGISEIVIDRHDSAFVWNLEYGRQEASIAFTGDEHMLQVIQGILNADDYTITPEHPIVEVKLTDGNRIRAIVPPASRHPVLHISKPYEDDLTLERMRTAKARALTPQTVAFLRACVQSRVNIIVAGGFMAAKKAALNALAKEIGEYAHIVAIQNDGYLTLHQPRVMFLETRAPNLNGDNAITMAQLYRVAMQMRPDRLILSEIQDNTVLDAIQAMSIGYHVMLSTYATSPVDALARLEWMAGTSQRAMPLLSIREQLAVAQPLLVQVQLMDDGFQRISQISEVQGLRGDNLVVEDIFIYEQTGQQDDGTFIGQLTYQGTPPQALEKFKAWDIDFTLD